MRRKLNSPKHSARRVPVKVYVKDKEEIPTMRKKLKELEKMQDMYKNRIDELENQISNFSFGDTTIDIQQVDPAHHSLRISNRPPVKQRESCSSDSGSSGVSVNDEPISSPRDNQYERLSLKNHSERTKLLALYDYVPQSDAKGRLPFKEGDVLLLVSMRSRSGWWTAELNGNVGKIPCNYVEQLDPSRAFKVRVIKNFDAQQPGDMSVQRGSLLTVLKKQENGWYLGEKGNFHGFFPSTSVERVISSFK